MEILSKTLYSELVCLGDLINLDVFFLRTFTLLNAVNNCKFESLVLSFNAVLRMTSLSSDQVFENLWCYGEMVQNYNVYPPVCCLFWSHR